MLRSVMLRIMLALGLMAGPGSAPGYAQQSLSDLLNSIASNLPTNGAGTITGAALRGVLNAMVSSNNGSGGTRVAAYSSVSAAIAAAAGGPLIFDEGTYAFSSVGFTAVPNELTFLPGAILNCGSNNFQPTGSINAGRYQIFGAGCAPNFFGANSRTGPIYPEWWGAIGDSNGTSGNGTDNTTVLQAAINQGVPRLDLCAKCAYRYSTLTVNGLGPLSIEGSNQGASWLIQDDPTGLLDGLLIEPVTSTFATSLCHALKPARGICSQLRSQPEGLVTRTAPRC